MDELEIEQHDGIENLCTLIAIFQIAATTSNESLSMRLDGRDGSNSQIAVVISMFVIWVIADITSVIVRLRT